MSKFKVGDKVRVVGGYYENRIGWNLTILEHDPDFFWDWWCENISNKQGYFFNEEDLELVSEKQEFKHIVHCPTEKEYKEVLQWLEDETELKKSGYNWGEYKENTAIRIGDTLKGIGLNDRFNVAKLSYYQNNRENYQGFKFCTAEEFLREVGHYPASKPFRELEKNKVHLHYSPHGIGGHLEDAIMNYYKTFEFNKPKKKIMSTIKNAFKSKENKALEYFGLGTKDNLNSDGLQEFLTFLYETSDKKAFLAKIVEAYKEDK